MSELSDRGAFIVGMLATWYTMSGAVILGAFILGLIPESPTGGTS